LKNNYFDGFFQKGDENNKDKFGKTLLMGMVASAIMVNA
jgi:hypothetical protein